MDLKEVGGTGLVTRMDGVTGSAGSLTTIFGVPTYKIDTVVSYTRDEWTVSAHGRYIPKSIYDPTKIGPGQAGYNINSPISQSSNFVSPTFYLDLSASVRLPVSVWGSKKMELYGAINNVFDTYPPGEERFFGNPLQYDPIGRAFRVGMRSNW